MSRVASAAFRTRRVSLLRARACEAFVVRSLGRRPWLRSVGVHRLTPLEWAVFVFVAPGTLGRATEYAVRHRVRTAGVRVRFAEESAGIASSPKRRRNLPPWFGVTTQFLVIMPKRTKSLMLGVTGCERQWGLVALEVPTPKGPEESARVYTERMFASHAHEMVGEFKTPEAACAAGDAYARRWLRARNIKPCDCRAITMDGRAAA